MSWYVRRGDREIGPLGEDALRALVGTGQITVDTQLRREGLSDWTAAFALPGILGPRAAAPTPYDTAPPWRRYWARSLDIIVGFGLASCLFGAIWSSLFARVNELTGHEWVVLLLLLPAALALDTLIYWGLGNTPGKAIAGIKVLAEGGRRPLSARAYLGRNFGVYVFGLGLGLPFITLVTLIYGYRRAAAGKESIWERFSGSRVYVLSGAALRTGVTAGSYLVVLGAVFALGQLEQHKEARYTATHATAPILRQELTQAANGVNASVPRMIDNITRLDGARAGPGPLFTYEYTLTNMRVSPLAPSALAMLRRRLSAHVRRAVCRGNALQPMLLLGVTVRFDYHDRDGRELAMASVSRADCGK